MQLVVDKIAKAFGIHEIFKDVSFMVEQGEHVGLVGVNGSGKTTLLRTILGEIAPLKGKAKIGSRVQIGYFSQSYERLNPEQTLLENFVIEYGFTEEHTRSMLGGMLFHGDDVFKKIGELSGGQKARLVLLKLVLDGANCLVLDEPTNHLDIMAREAVEAALEAFDGTVLVVSHDRYFLDKTVDHLLVFKGNGEIKDFPGNYTQYRDWNSIITSEEREKKEKEKKVTVPSKHKESQQGGKRKMTYKEKCKYEQLEKEITELEKEQRHIEEALNSGTLTVDELTNKSIRFSEIKQIIDQKSLEWLELAEIEG